jgi:putative transposase
MPRKPRFFIDRVAVHIVQRGHSRELVFFEDQDYATYIHWLKSGCSRYGIVIHSYCLMTNHVHILLTPAKAENVSCFMQYVGRHYVPYINYKYKRSGTLWEGRFKASLVDSANYLLSVMRYIELNPVRAGMVLSPSEYRWSGFKHNAGQLIISAITEHEIFVGLDSSLAKSKEWYLDSFKNELSEESIKSITAAWLTGTPIGSKKFEEKVEQALGKSVGLARKGPPKKVL